jgi:hypothetical protein
MIVAHVTHEAVEKIGGIGTVIAGLVTSDAYAEKVSRTILVGPLLNTDRPANRRFGDGGRVLYSSLDEIQPEPWREKFRPIERTYDVGVIYGTRKVVDACSGREVEAEVLLIDVFHANRDRLNLFKAELWQKFAIPSHDYENHWEFEQYMRLAEPGFEALKAIGCDADLEQILLLSHEYMGMPTALRAVLDGNDNLRTVFYAHEVASVRPIVEKMPGHDTMFYNVLEAAEEEGKSLEEVFPSVFENFKHPLVKAARYCDHVFAVGDYVTRELRFLDRHFQTMDIDLVYNGIPAFPLTLEEKRAARERMKEYGENLFGWRPDWVFSHVARPVLSKGIWRDLRVLHEMEPMLRERGQRAVYYMLGTLAGQRRKADIRQMERVYGWPVAHESGYPDLCNGEEVLGEMFDDFNRHHEAIRAVLVNQWDWNPEVCGERMPEGMTFRDIRCGIDVEFGLSVYEPFGISQFEGLSFGALCAVSNVCGCMGFARSAADDGEADGIIVEGDFLELNREVDLGGLLALPMSERDKVETDEARKLADTIMSKLADDDATLQRRIDAGYRLASKMSWEHVVESYFLPALDRAAARV